MEPFCKVLSEMLLVPFGNGY